MSREKDRSYRLTEELLRFYSDAALKNATELVQEAALLEKHGHSARAYFLAVSSIEETGKAILAFDAQGRNLSNPEVVHRLKLSFEDHQQKIISAFIPWLKCASNIRESAEVAMNLATEISLGREPSMYTNIHPEGPTIQTPATVVRKVAASDCVRLANDSLIQAKVHVQRPAPTSFSRADDELFALKPDRLHKILNTMDFWEYHIDQLEKGNQIFANSVIYYYKHFFLKAIKFNTSAHNT